MTNPAGITIGIKTSASGEPVIMLNNTAIRQLIKIMIANTKFLILPWINSHLKEQKFKQLLFRLHLLTGAPQ
ncbi:MAG: hypothetical protein KAQ70_02615 [Candidatus Heimdallarchaeota archaeon]|nr:hypothetical protein [Candidatus Heimdallarchaeota archaeon]